MRDLAVTPKIGRKRARSDLAEHFAKPMKLYVQEHFLANHEEETIFFYDKESTPFFREIDDVNDLAGVTRGHIMGHMQRMKERGAAPLRC